MKQAETPRLNFDEFAQEQWTEQERRNAKTVIDFFQLIMDEHNFEHTLETYGGVSYIQHNRAIPNNIEGLVAYVKNFTKRYPEYSFDIKKVIADGDFVVLHSHTTVRAKDRGNEKKGFIITDTF